MDYLIKNHIFDKNQFNEFVKDNGLVGAKSSAFYYICFFHIDHIESFMEEVDVNDTDSVSKLAYKQNNFEIIKELIRLKIFGIKHFMNLLSMDTDMKMINQIISETDFVSKYQSVNSKYTHRLFTQIIRTFNLELIKTFIPVKEQGIITNIKACLVGKISKVIPVLEYFKEIGVDLKNILLLRTAVEYKNKILIDYFLDLGADLNDKCITDAVAGTDDISLLDFLIDRGLIIDGHLEEMLEKAVMNNCLEMTKRLIEMGADATIDNDEIFITACECYNGTKIVKYFIGEQIGLGRVSEGLVVAVEQSAELELIEFLLKSDADPNIDNCILIPIKSGNVDTTELLLKYGASTSVITKDIIQQQYDDEYFGILKFLKKMGIDMDFLGDEALQTIDDSEQSLPEIGYGHRVIHLNTQNDFVNLAMEFST
jgi:ankyrin repeat protein